MSIVVKNVLPYGDSKTASSNYPVYFLAYLANTRGYQLWRVTPATIATGGLTVATAQDGIDASLAAATGTPDVILFNLGANDAGGALVEATWKADLAYILDAMNVKWASAQIYLMRVWRRDTESNCNLMATWIGDVIASRAWCHLGPDERVFLEAGDDGETYTGDGIHPNDAGQRLTAAQWAMVIP